MTRHLTRRQALATGVAAAATLGAAPAVARARLAYDLAPRQVADGVWMIEGSTDYFSRENGGAVVNTVFVETDAGPVIIDTGSSRKYGETLRDVATQVAGGDPAAVFITHHHPDHFFGDQAFVDTPIWALGETKRLAATHGDAYSDAMYRLVGDWMRGTEAVPPTDVASGGIFRIGGRDFEILPLAGHTEADMVVIDVRTGTVIAGDLAFYNRAPTTPSADLPQWRASLDVVAALSPGLIIPGHGPADSTGASLAQTRAYLDWLEADLRAAADQGYSMAEVAVRPLPEQWATLGAQPQEFQRSVAHLFPTYELEAMPRAN